MLFFLDYTLSVILRLRKGSSFSEAGKKNMKLNPALIQEEMLPRTVNRLQKDALWTRRLTYPCLYTGEAYWDDEAIYILRVEDAPLMPPPGRNLTFFFIGEAPPAYQHSDCNLLWITEQEEPAVLLNALMHIFRKYQRLERRILLAMTERNFLFRFGEWMHELSRNPISGLTADYVMLFMGCKPLDDRSSKLYKYYVDNWVLPYPGGNAISSEDISYSVADKGYMQTWTSPIPLLNSADLYGYRSLVYNVQNDGQTIASVIIDEVLEPLTDYHYGVISIAQELLDIYMHSENYSTGVSKDLERLTLELLEHRRVIPESNIQSSLNTFGWKWDDSYFCFILRSQLEKVENETLNSYAVSLERMIAESCCVTFRKEAFVVVNLSRAKKSREAVMAAIKAYLRDNLLLVCSTAEFSDYKRIYYYSKLAGEALKLGLRHEPSQWIYRAEDYLLPVLLNECMRDNVAETLLPMGLRRLICHDSEKGTEYVKLLEQYLSNERSLLRTAQAAYVHKNTLLYRLDRMKVLLDMDLDDPDIRLQLLIVCRLLHQT